MQHRRGVSMGASIAGGAMGIVHQDSTAVPLTSTLTSVLHRLARLNTVIKSAMTKGEEENSNQDGFKKCVNINNFLFCL